ncbi:MAG: 50S ribosomal protein L35 [Clostridiales bacterium]|jgi:large subunit ribosomal protein L35|nr:50S ribosomal protein L35 [Clostridiales bacterium]MDR2713073.1 50S ribosomal protein L35 [Clostridiales bacterium]
MPKIKTHRATAKRVKITGSGKLKRSQAFKRHILGKKTSKRKRNLRQSALVSAADHKRIKKLVPYL